VDSAERKDAQERVITSLLKGQEQEFFFPDGLLGFASCQRFGLSRYQPPDGSESPFFLLRAKEEDLSFPLISPRLLIPHYQLSPPSEVLTRLGAGSMVDLVILVIVTLRERLEETTANLQGPLLLNPISRLGLQLVVEDYPVRCPLLARPSPTW